MSLCERRSGVTLSMATRLGLSTRIGVAVLLSLAVFTAVVTDYVVTHPDPKDASLVAPGRLTATAARDAAAKRYILGYLANQRTAQSEAAPERTLSDLLPNRLYSVDGSQPTTLAAGLVVGRVSSVSPGVGYSTTDGSEVDFDTAHVSARTVVIGLAVEHGFGAASGLTTLSVGMKIPGDVDGATALVGLRQLGEVLLVCDPPGRFDFAPSLVATRQSTRLFGLVDAHGGIRFPALGDAQRAFLGSLTTVDALVTESMSSATTATIENGAIVG